MRERIATTATMYVEKSCTFVLCTMMDGTVWRYSVDANKWERMADIPKDEPSDESEGPSVAP